MSQKMSFVVVCIIVLVIAVSASVTEGFLQIPLFEVGGLWVQAVERVTFRLFISLTTLPDLTSPWTYIKMAVLLMFFYACYVILFRPLNRIRKLGDTGYVAEGSFSVKETANFVQKRRKIGNIPPPYPNGWFGLIESSCLKKGESKAVSVLGEYINRFLWNKSERDGKYLLSDGIGEIEMASTYCLMKQTGGE